MKHVWILNHYANSPEVAGGSRHYQLARYLPENGWRATLIAASVEHQTGRQRLHDGEQTRLEEMGNMTFLWLRTSPYRGNGWGRIKNMLEYSLQALKPSRLRDLAPPDLIIGSSVHPLAALSGWLLARRYHVPFIFEVRDLWPQTLIDMGRLREGSLAVYLMRALETFLYRRARRVITLVPKAAEYIVPRSGISVDRVVWISNGVDLADYQAAKSALPCSVKASFTLMYFGAHGVANGLDVLIRAMALVRDHVLSVEQARPFLLRLIGDGPAKSSLQELAIALALDDGYISFEPSVAKREIPLLAREADAFVISVRDLPELYRYGISMNKLFDYMAATRPVIIASGAENNPVADAGAGLSVPPENPEALAEAIIVLGQMSPEQRAQMGKAGRHHVERRYSYRTLAGRLAGVMDEVAEEMW